MTDTNISRRRLLQTTAAGATAATVGTVSMTDTASAQSLDDLQYFTTAVSGIANPALGAGAAAGAALSSYFGGGDADILPTPWVSSSEYENLSAEETWSRMYTQAKEIGAKDEITQTQWSNSLDRFRNAYFMEAKFAAIDAMNNGYGLSTTKNKAVEAGDAYASTVQKNQLKYWDVQNQTLLRMSQAGSYIENNYDEQVDKLFSMTAKGGASDGYSENFKSVISESDVTDFSLTLFDGSPYTITGMYDSGYGPYNNYYFATIPKERALSPNANNMEIPDGSDKDPYNVGDYETSEQNTVIDALYVYDVPGSDNVAVKMFDFRKWHRSYWKLGVYRNQASSEVKTWVDGIYDKYTAGEITETQLLNAYDLSDMSREGSYEAATVSLSQLGISGSVENRMTVELNDGTTLSGNLFLDDEKSFSVGETYSPGNINGSVYMAYSPEDSDTDPGVRKLEQSFAITSAENLDGQDVEEVDFDGRDDVELSSTDVQELKNELERLRDRNEELRENTDDAAGGGGGVGGGDIIDRLLSTPPWVLAAGAAVGAYLVFSD